MAPLRIELLGPFRIRSGESPLTGFNTSRLQSFLAHLVLHCDTPIARDRFAFLLWPDSSESQARTNLRQLLHHLRRALPADLPNLIVDHHALAWRRDGACTVDVWEFDEAIGRGTFEEAARLYRDDLLSGLYDDWITPLRAQYREKLAAALTSLAQECEQRRDLPGALRHAQRLVAHDPLCEQHHQLLIRLHAASNDRSGALRAYHLCMRLLRRELGVEPGAATRELFERVLKTDSPAALPAEAPPTAAAAPLPIVGRVNELSLLSDSWMQAAAGPMRAAVIWGEAGIGKSRLAEESVTRAARAGGAVARTRCYAGQGQLAYAPIADWLRSKPLRGTCSLLPPAQLGELARVLPEILQDHPGTPAPKPLSDTRERLFFYESLNAAFARARKPLLLAIDDLQWCDADSFEWLHCLLRSPASSQILLLGTARAEEIGRDHPLTRLLAELRLTGQLTEIALSPLDATETAALAAQVSTGPLAASATDELYRATRGNPLFVVESVRAGLGGATPPRIHAVISARLAQLPTPAHELAGFAAAIGRSFSFDLLARATDWDEASLNQALDDLWQRRIVEGHGAAEYDFTHDRLREVAYQELSLVRRRFLHRRLARVIDGPGAQAAHFEAAGMAEEAIAAYVEAASQARERYADSEAAGLLRRAIALCRAFPETARRAQQELDLLVQLGPALVTTQGYATPEVGETYARALELSRQGVRHGHWFAVLSGSWVYHIVSGRIAASHELAGEFMRMAHAGNEPALLLGAHFVAGSSLFHLGRLQESRDHMQQSLVAQSGPTPSVLALFAGPDIAVFGRAYLGHVLWHLGLSDEASRASGEALSAAQQKGNPFGMAIALDYSAMLHVFRGESAAALVRAEEAASLCRKHQFVYYLAVAEILSGWARAREGDAIAGLAQLRQGLEAFKANGAELRLPFYYALLAQACASAGLYGEAMANIATGLAFQSKNQEMWASPVLARVQAELKQAR